jgi:hypothetical protein
LGEGHRECGGIFALCGRGRSADLREAEIQDFDGAIAFDLDVVGFEVAMDNESLMRGGQGLGYLFGDAQGFVEGDGAFLDALLERRTFYQLHDEVIRTHVVYVADVRMIEGGDGAGLALETLVEPLGGNLDSDITAQARVMRAIDLSHATLANERHDFVGAQPITL